MGILYAETSHPIGGSALDNVPAIFAPGKVGAGFWVAFALAMGVMESNSMREEGAVDRRVWDPLNFAKDEATLTLNKNTELAFGRIGMIAAFGMIVEEFATGKPLLSGF